MITLLGSIVQFVVLFIISLTLKIQNYHYNWSNVSELKVRPIQNYTKHCLVYESKLSEVPDKNYKKISMRNTGHKCQKYKSEQNANNFFDQ